MPFKYLEFDVSEDALGHATFEAMASVGEGQWPALQAELRSVLDWAQTRFPGGPAPLDDGADWDCLLDAKLESEQPLSVEWRPASATLHVEPAPDVRARYTVTLTLTGTPAFVQAWHDRWEEPEAASRPGRRL